MNIDIISEMQRSAHFLPENLGKVLEVGSMNVHGSPRKVYPHYESYTGIDMRPGPDVDMVMNAHDLKKNFKENSFDTVINMNLLEHDDKFWLTVEGVNYVLKSGGYQIFCVPYFAYPEHNHPDDFWRMSESAVKKVILEGYDTLHLKSIYTHSRLASGERFYCYIGFAIARKK
jgi:hypothetical protein